METQRDTSRVYQGDDRIELYRYHQDIMYVASLSYAELEAAVMDIIYKIYPQHKSMKNDRIALSVFYNQSVVPLLR
jgi:hypothetical protein